MTRQHIEFVQAQHLPWQENLLSTHPGVSAKLLSRDEASGGISAILRYPPGWTAPADPPACSEEIFVLDGRIETDGHTLGRDCYAFWPSDMRPATLRSPQGAVVLTFLEHDGGRRPRPAGTGSVQPIECIDVRDMDWAADLESMGLGVMAKNARIATLRHDPATGDITYISAVIPYWRESLPEKHPVSQEFFVLSGKVAGNRGLMQAGAYTWRPPHCLHGPYGSTTGAVMLFRSTGGRFSTTHGAAEPFSYSPPYQPTLPSELAEYARDELRGQDRY